LESDTDFSVRLRMQANDDLRTLPALGDIERKAAVCGQLAVQHDKEPS
jgi:hypothetical protein